MGKNRQRQNRDPLSSLSSSSSMPSRRGTSRRQSSGDSITTTATPTTTTTTTTTVTTPSSTTTTTSRTFLDWCRDEREGLLWVLICAVVGFLFGFGIGTGHLTGRRGVVFRFGGGNELLQQAESSISTNNSNSPWRDALGYKIRRSTVFRIGTLQTKPWEPLVDWYHDSRFGEFNGGGTAAHSSPRDKESSPSWRNDPSHPTVFEVLREAIVREKGGYVHPDLGILSPAPCGAARGLGMVRFTYTACQTNCMPGVASEKLDKQQQQNNNNNETNQQHYKQEEVLLRIPLGIQMTRSVGLDTLLPLLPADIQDRAPLEELDDAAILVLLLAHERGLGVTSRYYPYISSLPLEPSCGYSLASRPYMLDAIAMMGSQLGFDVNAWPSELAKATAYADKIASGLTREYGAHLQHPHHVVAFRNIQWALCQVASRATAGSEQHGTLRLVPMADMINHDVDAGGFVELTGKERLSKGDFVESKEEDSGTFVVRSLRHGRRKPLKKGQELLVNYNVPGYSPLDWFVSLGFVPRERWSRWKKIDAALPRARTGGPLVNDPSRAGAAAHGSRGASEF